MTDIEKLKAAVMAAPAAPWLAVNQFDVIDGIGNRICETKSSPFSDDAAMKHAAFIAMCREAVPSLIAEVERLRAALEPFADEAKRYDPPEDDDHVPAWDSEFTYGDLRAARAALEGKP